VLIKAVQNGLDSQSLFHVLERVPRAHRGGVDRLERFHGDVAHGLGVVGMLPADTGAAPEYLGAVFPVLLAVPCGGPGLPVPPGLPAVHQLERLYSTVRRPVVRSGGPQCPDTRGDSKEAVIHRQVTSGSMVLQRVLKLSEQFGVRRLCRAVRMLGFSLMCG